VLFIVFCDPSDVRTALVQPKKNGNKKIKNRYLIFIKSLFS